MMVMDGEDGIQNVPQQQQQQQSLNNNPTTMTTSTNNNGRTSNSSPSLSSPVNTNQSSSPPAAMIASVPMQTNEENMDDDRHHTRSSSRSPLVRQRRNTQNLTAVSSLMVDINSNRNSSSAAAAAGRGATASTSTSVGTNSSIRSRSLPRRHRTRSGDHHHPELASTSSASISSLPPPQSQSQYNNNNNYWWPAFDEDVALHHEFQMTSSSTIPSLMPMHHHHTNNNNNNNDVLSVRNQRAYSDPQVRIENFFSSSDSVGIGAGSPPVIGDDGITTLLRSSNTSGTTVITSNNNPNNGNGNDNITNNNTTNNSNAVNERMERASRWIRINQCLNCTITLVALVFSLLLFTILVCWVVLTSAYVISIDKQCDVPLKTYYWFATLQLILDVFRGDIMRHIFHYDASNTSRSNSNTNTTSSNSMSTSLPRRVIAYNIAYIAFAMTVLYSGIRSVFLLDLEGNDHTITCPKTAPELFQTSKVFVVLSIAAWLTVILVYMIPFFFIALFLTRNGYLPPTSTMMPIVGVGVERDDVLRGGAGSIFPRTMTATVNNNVGAPPECIERLRVVRLQVDFPVHYPKECCICMVDFVADDVIVATECEHIFHKLCCQEWLRQSRTCPVCRTDIPASVGLSLSSSSHMNVNVNLNSSLHSAIHRNTVGGSSNMNRNRQRAGTEGSFTGEDIQREVVDFFRSFQDLRRGAQNSAGAAPGSMDTNVNRTSIHTVGSNGV